MENLELLYLFTSHLSTSDLVKCLTVSKLWNQVSHYHLWSSKPLLIPSSKSDYFLNSSIQNQTSIPIIKSLKINLSHLSTRSIFINQRGQLELGSIFKSIKTLTLNNPLNLSSFISKAQSTISKSNSNHHHSSTHNISTSSTTNLTRIATIVNHRQQIQEARQEFYQTLINEILQLEDLVNLNLINFLQSSSDSSSERETATTPEPQQPQQQPQQAESSSSLQTHHQKQFHQLNINDFLIKLSNGTPPNQIRLKSLNITKNHQLIDESLNGLSRCNPLSDSFQNPHLSSYLNHLTLIDCPLITQEGFFKFLESCQNLKTLKLGQMNQLFKSQTTTSNSISSETFNLFEQLSKHSNSLTSLTIQDISILLDTPTNSSIHLKLDTLELSRCQISSNLLRSFDSLKTLTLYHSSIQDSSKLDYSSITDHFHHLERFSLSTVQKRSFTYDNLNHLILNNPKLMTLIIDGHDRASRLIPTESISQQVLDQDLLTEAFDQNPTLSNQGLPANVLSVYGSFDILASQVPSNILIYILSISTSLEGVGLFGKSDEIEIQTEPECLEPHPILSQEVQRGFFRSIKNWVWNPPEVKRQVVDRHRFEASNLVHEHLKFKRSQRFYFFNHPLDEPVDLILLDRMKSEEDQDGDVQVSKRLMKDEINLLKSNCLNLINVWV